MKKSVTKLLAVTAALVTAACCTVGAAQPEESVAETETASAAAVEIGTADELLAFAQSVTDGSAGGYAGQTIVLTDDIDCTAASFHLHTQRKQHRPDLLQQDR